MKRFIVWVVIGIIAISIVQSLIQILIPIIYFLLIVIAVLCLYGLLPPKFRFAPIEKWLSNEEEKRKTATTTNTPPQFSSNIDFNRFANFSSSNRLPDRKELKSYLKSRVIGQEEAIEPLIKVVLGKLAAENSTKPLIVFLVGPTGVGKTELSKSLPDALGNKLIRFDMGEFADINKANNLFGSPKGYIGSDSGGALPTALRANKKRCIILFDEVEKAHESLWTQLYAFFDEGRVSDTLGQTIAPKDTICLLTSNIEGEKIANNPKEAKEIIKSCGYFPTAFVGRIDKIIPVLRLSYSDNAKLTVVLAQKIAQQYGISLVIDQEALEELMPVVEDEASKYGGRGISEKIKDLLLDDFVDLQTEGVSQAKLIQKNDRLTAVSIQFQSKL